MPKFGITMYRMHLLLSNINISLITLTIVEPVFEDERQIIVARSLVDPYKETIPVRIVNVEKYPIRIRKNYLLGELHPVEQFEVFIDNNADVELYDSVLYKDFCIGMSQGDLIDTPVIPENWRSPKVLSTKTDSFEIEAEIPKLPDFLSELYQKSCEKISDQEQKLKLAKVLLKNQGAFAKDKLDLGSCSLIKHKIDTAGAAPTRQPLRRTPKNFEGEEEAYLKDQLERGVIQPSSSAWRSNICLVRKKDGSGVRNPECKNCKSMDADWVDFKTDVDNVTNLSDNPFVSKICAVTRSQNSKLIDSNWLSGYTTKELENFQKEDSDLGPVHKWLDNNCKPNRDEIASYSPSTRKYWLNYDLLITKNNVLYQKRLQPTGESYQLLVPKVLRKEVMTSCHNTMYSAHFGVNKTKDKIKNCFHWYKMGEDIQSHVNTCSVCNRFKALNRKPKASLHSYTVGYPLDRVAIDVIGPLPYTRQNNKFILVIGDHFTRWMEAFPLPHQQAEKVAEKLVHEFISRFGIPLELHSDQGRNFESKIFTEVCKLLEIHKTRSTSYRPCSNGIIERFNATLEGMIRSFVNKNANDWDLHIGILMAAYRSTVYPATGYSPNMLMLGREITLPPQIIFPFPNCNESMEVETYVSKMRSKLEEIYQLAREHLRSSAVRQKKDYDSRISQNQFCKGSLVYKFNNIYLKN
ncbi:Hypothetical predicted protein [Mytilus galloprovincialis]|uniref:Integrase catalytic domain-containing protein n=1 Tax=Mytilus galloprovincialis TaxID=29158 RepID=A0A8B6GLQ7_MYTGA|nr:Hypothetical predicted protein [Mytilus galloprovincialis]